MEGLIGVAFKDFTILAADKTMVYSIIAMKHDQNKVYQLADNLLLGVSGEPGDTHNFAEFIAKNIKLYTMRNGFGLSPQSAANFIQRQLADSLRSRSPYQVNCLLTGFSEENGAEMFYFDYLGTMVKLPFAIHGYGGYLATSVFDRYYKEDCTEEEGYAMVLKVITEIQRRLLVNLPSFQVVLLSKDGKKQLPDVTINPLNLGI